MMFDDWHPPRQTINLTMCFQHLEVPEESQTGPSLTLEELGILTTMAFGAVQAYDTIRGW